MKADVKAERGTRLKLAREVAGHRTAAAFARSLGGVDDYTYRTYEAGTRNMPYEHAEKFARTLGVSLEWLLTGKTEYTGILSAPIRGSINDGGFITATQSLTGSEQMPITNHKSADLVSPHGAGIIDAFFCLRVETKQFEPFIKQGSQVFYNRQPQNPEDCVRSLCVIQVKNGKPVFGFLTHGSEPGLYDIQGHGHDLEIQWCARCEFTKHA